ncbi:MAG: EamA family transporter RarD [Nocardioides sp.]
MFKPRVPKISETRAGFAYGISAYVLWGLFPLYWPLLEPAGALEILGHRILWSVLALGVLVIALKRRESFRNIVASPRARWTLAGAAALITLNWATYIWGVNNERVVEAALGYFISPLLSVLLGVVVLGERLRRLQWAALALIAAAIIVLAVDYGRLPWVALVLACSFGTYGLLKKRADVGGVESLAFETVLAAPFAAGFLIWLGTQRQAEFGNHGVWHMMLIATTGLVTAVPLICFAESATRVSMVSLGLMQYLAPTIQFLLGVLWFGEPMPSSRLTGFLLVWAALIFFTAESLNHRRTSSRGVVLTEGAF